MKQKLFLLLTILMLLFVACGQSEDGKPVSKQDDDKVTLQPNTDTEDTETPDVDNTEDEKGVVDENAIKVSNPQQIVNDGKTFTGLTSLEAIEFAVSDPTNANGLSAEKFSHSYGVAKDGQPHSITVDNQARFDALETNALAWDNKSEDKVLYLTFDCGYEYENLTGDILDTLKEKNVPAAFFCTLDYLEDAPEFAARMINEGHIVGNHSTTHPSDSSALSREELAWELLGVHNYLRTNFGYESKYFRFPTGTYSENALELVDSVGYRSVFWSIAHADWDPQNQPGVSKSFETVTSRLHPGAVILLHACSPDNAAILGDFIDYAESQGYEFKSLDEYKYWDN
ncbi:MAG: polysaccharide deacetylase family protein [Tyzzerella sp.]|nr:polysaccharide deacetylase family protein [Tyzzerella sp.]